MGKWQNVLVGAFLVVIGYMGWQIFTLNRENAAIRAERVASDSLRHVALNQYECMVEETSSQRELLRVLKDSNAVMARDLEAKDATILQLTTLVVQLQADSGHGVILPLDSASVFGVVSCKPFRFSLQSDNGFVRVDGVVRPPSIQGLFTFKPLPPVTIVLYEDELGYPTARVQVPDSLMRLLAFHVESYKPRPIAEGLRFFVGAGPVWESGDDTDYGVGAMAGLTWRTWGGGVVLGPDFLGLMVIKTF